MCEKAVKEEGLVEVEALESRSKRQRTEKLDGSAAAVQFLPKMVLRVLLVEADDSTRQIITALLRKCRYKVLAVPDGLKAWEILKEKPHSIDIVLTEVELPSISGFSLLTLVMEHDVCKNIPIIMMSSHDSISTVLKCMLKGAADFLIKPVRKNELRILWQHVWRRHTVTSGCVPQNLVEVCIENTMSNHSSDYVVSSHQDKASRKIGCDARGVLQPKCNSASYLSNCDTEKHEECSKLAKEIVNRGSETEERSSKFGTEVSPSNEADDSIALRLEKDSACAKGTAHHVSTRSENTWNCNIKNENNCSSDEPLSRAMDLIGTFDVNRAMSSHVHSSRVKSGSSKAECTPQLELSLKRCALNHSNASAFSRYNNTKTLQPLFPKQAGNITKLEEGTDKTHHLSPNHCTNNTIGSVAEQGSTLDNNGASGATLNHDQSGQTKRLYARSQFGPVCIPGLRYFHVLPPLLYTKSEIPACQWEQSPSVRANTEMKSLKQGDHVSDDDNRENKLEGGEVWRHDFPDAGQNSTLHNGVGTELNSSQGGLIGMGSHRSSQREAALAKFRLKRKERCYEKKVRYQSRQRLAEHRPRVKGQFVRQEGTRGAQESQPNGMEE